MQTLNKRLESLLLEERALCLNKGRLLDFWQIQKYGMIDCPLPHLSQLLTCVRTHYNDKKSAEAEQPDTDRCDELHAMVRYSRAFAEERLWQESVLCLRFAWEHRDRGMETWLKDEIRFRTEILRQEKYGINDSFECIAILEDPDELIAHADRCMGSVAKHDLYESIIDTYYDAGATGKILQAASVWELAMLWDEALYAYAKARDAQSIYRLTSLQFEAAKAVDAPSYRMGGAMECVSAILDILEEQDV